MSTSSSIYSGGVVNLEELAQKYQRLLQDYSRTKAQHSVLRKAVLQEQANNAKLLEQLKTKEQELKNLEQELDVLSFHNKGLTKKVEVLQGNSSKPSFKTWGSNTASKQLEEVKIQLEAAILDLQNKIVENENLYRQLDDIKTSSSLNHKRLSKQSQALEDQLALLKEQQLNSENLYSETITKLTSQKEAFETEVQRIMESMEKLSAQNSSFPAQVDCLVDETHLELFKAQTLVRENYLLLNSPHGASNYDLRPSAIIIKELIAGTSPTRFETDLDELIVGFSSLYEAVDKRMVYLSEQFRSSECNQSLLKFRDDFKNVERSLSKFKTLTSSFAKDVRIEFIRSEGFSAQALRILKDLRKTSLEFLLLMGEMFSHGVSILHLESQLLPNNSPEGSGIDLDVNLQELLVTIKNISIKLKSKSSLYDSNMNLIVDLRSFRKNLLLSFKKARQKLSSESLLTKNLWLLKALNSQIIASVVSIELIADKLLGQIERWIVLFLAIDDQMHQSTVDAERLSKVQLGSRKQNFVRALRREFTPTFIPYSESIILLNASVNNKREKEELRARLDQERDRSNKLEILLTSFQKQVEDSKISLIESQSHYKELLEKYTRVKNETHSNEKVIDRLEKQVQESQAALAQLSQTLEGGKDETLEVSQVEPQILATPISTPPIVNTNVAADETFSSLLDNTSELFPHVLSSKENEELEALSPIVISPNPPSSLTNGSESQNVNFLKYLSNEEHYVEKVFKLQYETKLKVLTEKVETADSQAKRYHDAWLLSSKNLAESNDKNRDLSATIDQLRMELSKVKDEMSTLEAGYKTQLDHLTEQYAKITQK